MGTTDETTSGTRRGDKPVTGGAATTVRLRVSQVIWLVAVVCALVLALGALLIALDANPDNALVKLVHDVANALDLGVFSLDNGIFTFKGSDAETKSALANWGLAAIAYLIVGRILERIVRP